MEEIRQILAGLDWSPLFISIKTGIAATIVSFFLGIWAARKVLKAKTEGIVVLEALACEIPTIVRNIPVYEGWLEDEKQVYKAETIKEFQEKIIAIFSRDVRLMKKEERKIACNKSLGKVGERLLRLYFEME